MKAPITLLFALTLTSGNYGLAQRDGGAEDYYPAPSTVQGKMVLIPAGTTFEGRIDSKIGSSVSHAGQRFTITMSSPVLANGTDVLIPAGSQILGEVVQAIPSGSVPHEKQDPKPTGKLRVQINGLRTPDGITYPLVASLIGEVVKQGRGSNGNPALGGGVGYVGSSSSFEAVAPGRSDGRRNWGRGGPTVVTREELMRDPIYGKDRNSEMYSGAAPTIRSLVKRGHELYISQGAPLSIKLEAPLKMGLTPANLKAPQTGGSFLPGPKESGQHFSRSAESAPNAVPAAPASTAPPSNDAPPQASSQSNQPAQAPDNSF